MSTRTARRAVGADRTRAEAAEVAWRVLDGVQERIGAADAKIGVAAALELGILTATAALAGTTTHPSPAWSVLVAAALFAQLGSILTAVSCLMPRIRSDENPDSAGSLTYFGTLRTLTPAHLAEQLRTADLLDALTHQCVHTSAIAWTKHARLRWSLRLVALGLVLAVLAAAALTA